MENKEVLIFVKSDKEVDFLESCPGLFYPVKFDTAEYIKWKSETDRSIQDEYLTTNHKEEASLYNEIYQALYRNFTTAMDREFMLYTKFLIDPRDLEKGYYDSSWDGYYEDPDGCYMIYDEVKDRVARFTGPYKDLYSDFIAIMRSMTLKKPIVAPAYIIDALEFEKNGVKNEIDLDLDHINKSCHATLSKWGVIRRFIKNNKAKFPKIDQLLDVYGEPYARGLSQNILTHDKDYVDLVEAEDLELIKTELVNTYGEDRVKCYELPN